MPIVLTDLENLHDVRMVESSRRVRLAPKAFAGIGIRQIDSRYQFDGDVAAHRLLNRLIHYAHAAAANLPDNAVLSQTQRMSAACFIRGGNFPRDCVDFGTDEGKTL